MTQVTGIVESVELKEREPFEGQSRYSPNSTRTEKFLQIKMVDKNNVTYYFNTPAASMTVTVAPGCAVVTHRIENGAAQWMQEVGKNKVATPNQKNDNTIVPLVDAGDEVKIAGRLTMKTSKYGNKYGKLTHVKRIEN